MNTNKKYESFIEQLIVELGGTNNIIDVIHCITRLRFTLKNEEIVDDNKIEQFDEVVSIIKQGGQYQIVIGTHVSDVYEELSSQLITGTNEQQDKDTSVPEKKKNVFSAILGTITGSIAPVIGILAASGITKGVLSALVGFGIINDSFILYIIFDAISDAVFYFMPVLLGFSAAKIMKSNEIIGATLGAILIYPTLIALASTGNITTILGIPIRMQVYTSTVFPVIMAVYLSSHIEKFLKKNLATFLQMIFIPLISIVVVTSLMLLFVGPVINIFSTIVANFILSLFSLSPAIFGAFAGGTMQLLVIFGLHWGFLPIAINDLVQNGFSYFIAINSVTIIAQGAAALAVFFKLKEKSMRELSIAATISAFFGITEPAVYGITLKYKNILIITSLCSAIGGFFAGLVRLKSYGFAGSFIGFTSYINPDVGIDSNFYLFWVISIITLIVTFVLTYLFGFTKEEIKQDEEKYIGKK